MALKRKSLSKLVGNLRKTRKAVAKKVERAAEEEVEEEVAEEAVATMKKPAAAAAKGKKGKRGVKESEEVEETPEAMDDDGDDDDAEDGEDDEEVEEEVSEEVKLAQQEKDTVASRKKEVKSMYMDELKKLTLKLGLDTGKKEDMVDSIVSHEAKERASKRENEAKLRAVVLAKKTELDAIAVSELKKRLGVKGAVPKPDLVEQLLGQWLKDDGVDKALAKIAFDARRQELTSMDKPALVKLCDKSGVDYVVKEVMVERIVKSESEAGRFVRPTLEEGEKKAPETAVKKDVDFVEALLASEVARKKELEVQKKHEDAAAGKIRELKAMSVEDLKKKLSKQGVASEGKKEELVVALFKMYQQEEALVARRAELKSMGKDELMKLVSCRGLEVGKKTNFVDVVLEHEAKTREAIRAHEVKVQEVSANKKKELEKKSGADLKDMCVSKGLKAEKTIEDRVNQLLETAKKDGEVDKIVGGIARDARREELSNMDKTVLQKICGQTGIDALVKEIMVERVLAHESEYGLPEKSSQPAAKKARK